MANIDYNIRYRTIRLTYANKEEMDFLIEKNVLTYQNLFKDQPIVNIRYGNAEFAEKLRLAVDGAEEPLTEGDVKRALERAIVKHGSISGMKLWLERYAPKQKGGPDGREEPAAAEERSWIDELAARRRAA